MLNPFINEKLEYILDHTEAITLYFNGIKHPAHYEKLDTDIIFEICRDQIPELISSVKKFLNNN